MNKYVDSLLKSLICWLIVFSTFLFFSSKDFWWCTKSTTKSVLWKDVTVTEKNLVNAKILDLKI